MKKLSILGSTGSIGQQTLEVASLYPDQFSVVALAAGSNLALMEEQVRRFSPRLVSLETKDAADQLTFRLRDHPIPLQVEWGKQGLLMVATHPESDLILSAVVGAAGLLPTLEAIRAGKDVALANKEAMVMAGELIGANTPSATASGRRSAFIVGLCHAGYGSFLPAVQARKGATRGSGASQFLVTSQNCGAGLRS